MCRLFGMTSGTKRSRATFWLLEVPDSLSAQSHRDPDGTGLGAFRAVMKVGLATATQRADGESRS